MQTNAEMRAACLKVEKRAREAIRSAMRELKEIIDPEGQKPPYPSTRSRVRALKIQRAMWNGLVWTVLEAGMETFSLMVLDEAWLKALVDRVRAVQKGQGRR